MKPDEGKIVIDLRDNPDNQHNGLNLTKATATAAALAGALSALPEDLPTNAGTFRRFEVLLRDGCVVGVPSFPYSCSSATTNLADRVVGLVRPPSLNSVTASAWPRVPSGRHPARR